MTDNILKVLTYFKEFDKLSDSFYWFINDNGSISFLFNDKKPDLFVTFKVDDDFINNMEWLEKRLKEYLAE